MGKRRIRLDEEDLVVLLEPALRSSGFMAEDTHIVGFEYKTRRIRRGGDYYDSLGPEEMPPEGVEVVRWIKVLTDTKRRKHEESEDEDVAVQEEGTDERRGGAVADVQAHAGGQEEG